MKSSLDPLFSPRSVAVVGASRSRDSIGWAIVHNLVQSQFAGAIYPVNPKAEAIHSLKCYPSLTAIPDPIDLALVVVPKPLVETTVDEGLARGVRGFVSSPPASARRARRGAPPKRECGRRCAPPARG